MKAKIGLILMAVLVIGLLVTAVFADVPEPPHMIDLRYGQTTTVSCEGGAIPLAVYDGVGESVILTCLAQGK
jgi:hypothetical protein